MRHTCRCRGFFIAVLLVLLRVVPAHSLLALAITGIAKLLGLGREKAGAGRGAGHGCCKNGNDNERYEKKKTCQGKDDEPL